jgi:3-deoxy-D-manno-octulosonate 8-phosphate phosphatase (KDO 8-P phosphatase)
MVKYQLTSGRFGRCALPREVMIERARRIRLVLTDSDGVLTDTGVYYSEAGEALKRFSIRDGMGAELLRNAGVETVIITGEISASVRRRAEKLQMKHLYLGVKDKREHLQTVLQATSCQLDQVAYIGDDINDLGIIEALLQEGLTGAPADAVPAVADIVHYHCMNRGGNGAFREFADWILANRTDSPRTKALHTRKR